MMPGTDAWTCCLGVMPGHSGGRCKRGAPEEMNKDKSQRERACVLSLEHEGREGCEGMRG